LFNNTTDIQPAIHSTDTHGTNEVNFAILNVFSYQFAPCYRNICDKVKEALYGFKHPSQYDDDWILKPVRKLNPELVVEEWDNIQRIMVSLALKTTTQHINQWCSSLTNQVTLLVFYKLNSAIERGTKPDA
jgi:hypothetical protein